MNISIKNISNLPITDVTTPQINSCNTIKDTVDVEKNEAAHLKDQTHLENWAVLGQLKSNDDNKKYTFMTHFWNVKDYPFLFLFKIPRLFGMQAKLTDEETGKTYKVGQIVPTGKRPHNENFLHQYLRLLMPSSLGGLLSFGANCILEKTVENEGWNNDKYHVGVPLCGGNYVDLELTPSKMPLLLGDKGNVPITENAQMTCYHQTAVNANGKLQIKGKEINVSGTLLIEHFWSDKDFLKIAKAWDWSIINLGGTQITAFKFWDENAKELKPVIGIIYPDGKQEVINNATFKATETWQNPNNKVKYPVKWELNIPEKDTHLTMNATYKEQMVPKMSFIDPPYWEGNCKIEGVFEGKEISPSATAISGSVGHEKMREAKL